MVVNTGLDVTLSVLTNQKRAVLTSSTLYTPIILLSSQEKPHVSNFCSLIWCFAFMLTLKPHSKTVSYVMAAWGGDSCNSSLRSKPGSYIWFFTGHTHAQPPHDGFTSAHSRTVGNITHTPNSVVGVKFFSVSEDDIKLQFVTTASPK